MRTWTGPRRPRGSSPPCLPRGGRSAGERHRERSGHSFAPALLVDEEARDPPIRKGRQTFAVGAPVLDARQLVGRPELAPAHAGRAVVHESSVSTAFPNSTLLLGSVLHHRLGAPHTLGVEGHAPTAAPYPVVHLDQPREIRPRGLVQRFHAEARHRSPFGRDDSACPTPVGRHSSIGVLPAPVELVLLWIVGFTKVGT